MNIHPLFVHFPIALLTVYALLEILRFPKLKNWQHYFNVKAFLVILGALAGWVTIITGAMAKQTLPPSPELDQLVMVHATFALASILIFSLLAICYLAVMTKPSVKFTQKVVNSWIAPLVALIGVVCISTTGALGGIIVFGPSFDPISNFIYNLLF